MTLAPFCNQRFQNYLSNGLKKPQFEIVNHYNHYRFQIEIWGKFKLESRLGSNLTFSSGSFTIACNYNNVQQTINQLKALSYLNYLINIMLTQLQFKLQSKNLLANVLAVIDQSAIVKSICGTLQSFYNVKYGSSIITSKSSSKNLSNQNKHLCFCCLQDKT